MKILFWNTHKNRINDYLIDIIYEESIDIIILAEYTDDVSSLIERLKQRRIALKKYFNEGCDRIIILGKNYDVKPSTQDHFYSIQVIQNKYILCGLHFPSDLHQDESNNRYHIARRCIHDIHQLEKEIDSDYTIIVGDMNEMPYELSVMSADGFHGLSFSDFGNDERIIDGESFPKYYNPMWNLFGDINGSPGTYYRNESKICTPMWFMLDQFVLSSSCAKNMNKSNLKIITKCLSGSLVTNNGIPDKKISDHLPIMCEIFDGV